MADAEVFSPVIGHPAVYFLVDSGTTTPFYVGEYGKSEKYDVVERIRFHFHSSGGTRARVLLNMAAFGYSLPPTFTAYVKLLGEDYQNGPRRESLEAWIIHILCHERKAQSSQFCVVSHVAPRHIEERAVARQILDELMAQDVEEMPPRDLPSTACLR